MTKFVVLCCLVASAVAVPAPDAQHGRAYAALTIQRPNCEVSYEEIETQHCVPKKERICENKEVEQETLTYERECKEVMSKDCKPERVLYKREAEPEAWGVLGYGGLGYGYGGYGGYAAAGPAAVAAAPAPAAPAAAPAAPKEVVGKPAAPQTRVTIKKDCREVTKEVCVNTPKKESKKVPVTNCHVKQTVDCKMITKRIPKKNCEPIEEKVPVGAPAPHAPVGAGYGGYGAGYGLAGRGRHLYG